MIFIIYAIHVYLHDERVSGTFIYKRKSERERKNLLSECEKDR